MKYWWVSATNYLKNIRKLIFTQPKNASQSQALVFTKYFNHLDTYCMGKIAGYKQSGRFLNCGDYRFLIKEVSEMTMKESG